MDKLNQLLKDLEFEESENIEWEKECLQSSQIIQLISIKKHQDKQKYISTLRKSFINAIRQYRTEEFLLKSQNLLKNKQSVLLATKNSDEIKETMETLKQAKMQLDNDFQGIRGKQIRLQFKNLDSNDSNRTFDILIESVNQNGWKIIESCPEFPYYTQLNSVMQRQGLTSEHVVIIRKCIQKQLEK
ncbi:unnamed protein product [Didymodactylos carnosus]|uniref:Kinetochore protein SPC25 n=1 Tax=Didymodactylos carnosus TaxID=1234261 RepID=A0A815JVS7_9BILA|nr:unnamed protein product [Didymodactylos carnosus]CAF1385142.1 unnamed protein product [Didymodactylos carnosus]CAF4039605.1 unnamed protein product [Didymodactylos carnosus]CAF4280300.1 unnamed protein product [Didymodactylos carnosus]